MDDTTLKSLKVYTLQKTILNLNPPFQRSIRSYACQLPSDATGE